MPYIRHESLLPCKSFMKWKKDRFLVIFSAVDITSALRAVTKKSPYGAPVEANYQAMIYSLIARIVERISTIKDLLKRLGEDVNINCKIPDIST